MRATAYPATGRLDGRVVVPGDKSISHRAVLFAAMAEGSSLLTGVLESEDVRATIRCTSALGARIDESRAPDGSLTLAVTGWGASGPREPNGPLDCGNSGTSARLLMGVLAGSHVESILGGDESLSRRPMGRVADPLRLMGADIELSDAGTLPALVQGRTLRGISYETPVASAQVKSALLLAGCSAEGRTTVVEPARSRDHTERMLGSFGVYVGRDDETRAAWIDGPVALKAADVTVPGDPSSAAFLACAALMVWDSQVVLRDVALNPTRIGFLGVVAAMGANIEAEMDTELRAEPVGTFRVRGDASLSAVTVEAEQVPSLVDEVPVLAVLATQASGTTRFEGVGELRVKESDRLAAIHHGLDALGATVRSGPDWLEVEGPARLRACALDSLGDHRLAMAWAVAALVADGPVTIDRWESVAVSYPGFAGDLSRLGAPPVVLS